MNRRIVLLAAASALACGVAVAAPFAAYDAASFDRLRSQAPAVVVHVHADWCSTCRAQAPILQTLADDPAYAAVRFVRVNFDRDTAFMRANNVTQRATIVVYRGGVETDRMVYITDPAQIRDRVRRGVARPS